MNELGKNRCSLGLLLVERQILNPSDHFIHVLIGDGRIISWNVKKISSVIYNILESPCLFLAINKELGFR